jgi:hypothetical protein
MGYSCTAAASDVVDKWVEACVASTGSSNTWRQGKDEFFFEVGREQPDGAVTGSVYKAVSQNHCRRSGTFRVAPDGTVERAPAFLKEASR